jgi:UDP-glucose 4-epimerase
MMHEFDKKSLCITGGTGSFGGMVLQRFLASDIQEIRIFSRDEKKQDDLRRKYSSPKLRFFIGDVRDEKAVLNATRGVDFIFHAAALKQVPSCEFHPLEAVKTNVLGTENVLEAAILNNVGKVVCLSTDKAVYPVNAMGISKAMMEKVFAAKAFNAQDTNTTICGTRYGNVMASRGSVIPLFVSQIKNGEPLTITNSKMTRFMMTLHDAVDLVMHAFTHGRNGDMFVQKSPACSIAVLVKAIKSIMNVPAHPEQVIGMRHGEKIFETLVGSEEMAKAESSEKYFRVPPDFRDLNYNNFIDIGEKDLDKFTDFNSHNARQLDQKEVEALLLGLGLFDLSN